MTITTVQALGQTEGSLVTPPVSSPVRLKRKRDADDEGEQELGVPPKIPKAPRSMREGNVKKEEEDVSEDDEGRVNDSAVVASAVSPADPPRVGNQVLPVADLPDDFDAEPEDGMEYLFTVR